MFSAYLKDPSVFTLICPTAGYDTIQYKIIFSSTIRYSVLKKKTCTINQEGHNKCDKKTRYRIWIDMFVSETQKKTNSGVLLDVQE